MMLQSDVNDDKKTTEMVRVEGGIGSINSDNLHYYGGQPAHKSARVTRAQSLKAAYN